VLPLARTFRADQIIFGILLNGVQDVWVVNSHLVSGGRGKGSDLGDRAATTMTVSLICRACRISRTIQHLSKLLLSTAAHRSHECYIFCREHRWIGGASKAEMSMTSGDSWTHDWTRHHCAGLSRGLAQRPHLPRDLHHWVGSCIRRCQGSGGEVPQLLLLRIVSRFLELHFEIGQEVIVGWT